MPPLPRRLSLLIFPFFSFALSGWCAEEPNPAPSERIDYAGGNIELQCGEDLPPARRHDIREWVLAGARGVSDYFGRFPVTRVRIMVTTEDKGADIHGTTYGGRLIRMRIGRDTTRSKFRDDWTMTHEMFHLAFPDMMETHLWMNEGLSTYLEPLARTRIGILSREEYWKELVEGLPQGLPEAGDRGLDRTHTWGRTYWGGCLFWFIVDLRIREQTHNRQSLDDGLLAVLDAGGDGFAQWSVERVGNIIDAATGVHAFAEVYADMASKPSAPDLASVWKRLGVGYDHGKVRLDDRAPLADIRRSMLESKKR